ncbi:ribonuclease H-like domain-containing protein [Xylaria sp. FL1042]|nr:ribonuclease H-like domain-containing protein [Xylaria sp. FL1042]
MYTQSAEANRKSHTNITYFRPQTQLFLILVKHRPFTWIRTQNAQRSLTSTMVYVMEFYVDGGCRGNGRPWAVGAAACVLKTRSGSSISQTLRLPRDEDIPTNQRAEITAIIMALEWALEKYEELNSYPRLVLRIHSDSRYAIGCMDNWIYKWARNGWQNAAGYEVANRDLIEKASDLDDKVKELGSVDYIWVPRSENEEADELCNDMLDELEY